jgi:hypothetical protein
MPSALISSLNDRRKPKTRKKIRTEIPSAAISQLGLCPLLLNKMTMKRQIAQNGNIQIAK